MRTTEIKDEKRDKVTAEQYLYLLAKVFEVPSERSRSEENDWKKKNESSKLGQFIVNVNSQKLKSSDLLGTSGEPSHLFEIWQTKLKKLRNIDGKRSEENFNDLLFVTAYKKYIITAYLDNPVETYALLESFRSGNKISKGSFSQLAESFAAYCLLAKTQHVGSLRQTTAFEEINTGVQFLVKNTKVMVRPAHPRNYYVFDTPANVANYYLTSITSDLKIDQRSFAVTLALRQSLTEIKAKLEAFIENRTYDDTGRLVQSDEQTSIQSTTNRIRRKIASFITFYELFRKKEPVIFLALSPGLLRGHNSEKSHVTGTVSEQLLDAHLPTLERKLDSFNKGQIRQNC